MSAESLLNLWSEIYERIDSLSERAFIQFAALWNNLSVLQFGNRYTGEKEVPKTDDAIDELLMHQIRPVCGWIVCIEGPRKGKDYKIHEGKNFIGRADDMDIQILGDNRISRRNHAVLVYDPKKHETVLLPGDSNGIVYHNDAALYSPVVLSVYDVIELGNSKFLFIPFCGEHFRWEDSPIEDNKNYLQFGKETN